MSNELDKLIVTDKRFARAANILTNDQDLKNIQPYIFTNETSFFLKEFIQSVKGENNRRAWTIFGPYGTGKSLLSLFISKIFSGNSKNTWCEQVINSLSSSLKKELNNLIESKQANYFVVPVSGSQSAFGFEILKAIYESAKNESWASDEFLNKLEVSIETYNFSNPANEFKKIIKYVSEVACLASFPKKKGLLVIVDECGQFLEYEAKSESSNNLIMLQYLAEEAINSEKFSLITTLHRGIMNYAPSGLDSHDLSDWERTAGRFESIQLGNLGESQFDLISKTFEFDLNALKESSFENNLSEWGEYTWNSISKVLPFNKEESKKYWEKKFKDFYPLHPFSVYSLPILSGILGQNTRTIFSFLASRDPNGFSEFLNKNKISKDAIPVLQIDYLYDYFFLGPGTFTMQEEVRKIKNSASYAIANLDNFKNKSEIRLIKNMAILYALKSSGAPIKLDKETIKATQNKKENKTLELMLDYLETRKLITYRDWEDEYILWQGSGFDLKSSIRTNLEKIGTDFDFNNIISNVFEIRDFVARKHSLETGTTRGFKWFFLDGNSLEKTINISENKKFEGIIYQVLPSSKKEIIESEKIAENDNNSRIIISIPNEPSKIAEDIKILTVIYQIINQAPELKDDPIAMEEINASIDSYKSRISNALNTLCLQGFDKSLWWNNGKLLNVTSRADRNSKLSHIFDKAYDKAPIVKNEMINKLKITPQAFKAQKDFIDGAINFSKFEGISLSGNGPEVGIYRSLFKDSLIHKKIKNKWGLSFSEKDDPKKFRFIFKFIEDYVTKNESEDEIFSNIIIYLQEPPYGIRQNLSKLLIWVWLILNKEKIILFDNGTFVEDWNPVVYDRFSKHPEFYTAKNFSKETLDHKLFSKLSNAIDNSIIHPTQGKRGIKGNEEWVGQKVFDIQTATIKLYSWYKDLEEYQKDSNEIYDKKTLNFLKDLKYTKNPLELFSSSLSKYENKLDFILFSIKQSYVELLIEIRDRLIKELDIKRASSAEDIFKWGESIDGGVVEKINNPNSKQFFRDLKQPKNEPVRYIETLAGSLVDRNPPKFWDDKVKNNFFDNVVIAREDLINAYNMDLIKKIGSGEHLRLSEKALLISKDGKVYTEIKVSNKDIYKVIKNIINED